MQSGKYVLERSCSGELAFSRETETVLIHGIAQPRAVKGATFHGYTEGTLELTVPSDWQHLELSV